VSQQYEFNILLYLAIVLFWVLIKGAK